MRFAGIILAAGSSSRMGRSKQMLEIHGETLLVKTIRTFLHAGVSDTVVVLGANEKAHLELIKNLSVEIVHNPDWEKGMGTSIKRGLHRVAERYPAMKGVIISVCDQPLLSEQTIANLITRHDETMKPVIASGYAEAAGVPALFHKKYFEKLEGLGDDEGAKKIILKNLSDVSVVPFPGGEIDLDTAEDYRAYLDGMV